MEVDTEATTDSFRMVAVLWRWILKRQPIVLGWLLFMEVDIEATTESGWLLFYGSGY